MFFLFGMIRSTITDPVRLEDDMLLKAVASGQSAALGTLYDRYSRLVFSLAFHIVNDEAVAEEVTQEVFLQVWNKAGSYQTDLGKFSTWLTSVARHRAIDCLRRRNVRPEGNRAVWDENEDSENSIEPQWVDPTNIESQVELTLQSRVVRQAIAQLPNEQQVALALAYFQGLSHQEIAEKTGEPLGTIKTRIRLAMQKLRQVLEHAV
jgi:RNA polymerase sigma-70 factor, ECF subfamily